MRLGRIFSGIALLAVILGSSSAFGIELSPHLLMDPSHRPLAQPVRPPLVRSDSKALPARDDIPEPARSAAAAVVNGQRVYYVGGHLACMHNYFPAVFSGKTDVYDLTQRKWLPALAELKPGREGFQLSASGRYLFGFGGFVFSGQHMIVDTRPIPLPYNQPCHKATAWYGYRSLNDIFRYDTQSDQWEVSTKKLFVPRSSYALGVVGDKVYLLGGWNSAPNYDGDTKAPFITTVEEVDVPSMTNPGTFQPQAKVLNTLLPYPPRRAAAARPARR